jgi:hypothetical protein
MGAYSRAFWPAAIALLAAVSLLAWLRGENPLAEGPQLQNALVTKSLWHDHTLALASYRAAADQYLEFSKGGDAIIQDAFALDADGRFVPKHSLLTAWLALPLYALFGNFGFWLFNQAMLLAALGALRVLVRRVLGQDPGLVLLLLVFGLTQTGAYIFGFHYDVTALALVLVGFALLPAAPFWGMAILMLAAHIRVTSLLLAPPLLLATPTSPRRLLHAALGAGLVLGLLLMQQAWLWGHPLRTAYHSLPMFVDGAMVVEPHPLGLSLDVFAADWHEKLFGVNVGLLRWNSVLLLLPVAWLVCVRHPARRFFAWTAAALLVQFVVIFSYPAWNASHLGNRFLFPAIYLALPPILLLLQTSLRRMTPEGHNQVPG